jgi:hypothetical protein
MSTPKNICTIYPELGKAITFEKKNPLTLVETLEMVELKLFLIMNHLLISLHIALLYVKMECIDIWG